MNVTSVNKQLEASFKANWWKPALSNYCGETMNYAMMAERIEMIHVIFKQCGLVPGDKVAICGRNQANWGVCFLAAMTYGAVPVPILHEFNADSIVHLIEHSESKVFFVDEVVWAPLREVDIKGLKVAVNISDLQCLMSKIKDLETLRNAVILDFYNKYPCGLRPESLDYYKDSPDELAIINYTSGTSGFSKGVMIPYRAIACNMNFATWAEPQMDSNSRIVSMLPLAHMYGLMFEFLFEMSIGAHVYFLTKTPSPRVIMDAFQEIHPSVIIAVPLIIEKVYKTQLRPVADKLRFFFNAPFVGNLVRSYMKKRVMTAFGGEFEEVILGGAAVNPEVERFFHKLHFPFTVGYGMTECAPIITYTKWKKAKVGSSGKAIGGCQIRVVSSDPAKIPGEVQVKGQNVFLGYYKNEAATKETFTEDGWFRTGDMGIIKKDGSLYLKGRCKCMILSANGQNIYPEELEAVINNYPYVVDSLVVEDKGGLTALIYPDYAAARMYGISQEDVMGKLQGMLPEINKSMPAYAQIRHIEFLDKDFERTPKRNIKRYLYQKGK